MRKSALTQCLLMAAVALAAGACNSNNPRSGGEATAITEEAPSHSSPETDFTIVPGQRVGSITATSTEADIKALYGEEQVEYRSVYIGEGESQPGIAVFPGTPNELEIVWDIAAATGNPEFIRISKENTDWRTVQGVTVGTSLEELERINGRPFSLYGFGWDYSGLANDWKGGQLNSYLIIALEPADWEKAGPEVSGDRTFSSDDPKVRALGAKVASMVVTFRK
ncbi:MAG: hypothetical protein H6557_12840 [Lewinellaceae bacterium]|nr:hypothetical protein [Phaeodactylibacter sp.]MCB9037496.1 hypothetical protein [Lewinellaceae bacterium]